jgi:hypothetical protein
VSDNWVILIPTVPGFVPAPEAANKAVAYLKGVLPQADDVTCQSSTRTRFIDCGTNLESIHCPRTGKEIPIGKWQEAMTRAAETDFVDLRFVCPCSGEESSLDQLVDHFPQGFAKFSLEAMNPGVPTLAVAQIQELEKTLGCKLMMILQHL